VSGALTEQTFPAVWLRLVAPVGDEDAIRELVDCAVRSGTVLDISASPALFGGYMRATDAALMAVGPNDLARAIDDEQAHSLVLAHLVETLSAIGRDYVDFYFLKVDGALREDQISGALMALHEARDQKNLTYIGIAAKNGQAALSLMHLHDVFDAIVVYEHDAMSRPLTLLAESRGMTVVRSSLAEHFAPPPGSFSPATLRTSFTDLPRNPRQHEPSASGLQGRGLVRSEDGGAAQGGVAGGDVCFSETELEQGNRFTRAEDAGSVGFIDLPRDARQHEPSASGLQGRGLFRCEGELVQGTGFLRDGEAVLIEIRSAEAIGELGRCLPGLEGRDTHGLEARATARSARAN